jgi:1-acylglycerone phosphate reductase
MSSARLTTDSVGFVLPLLDTEVSEAKKIFDVNVFGVIEVCKAFAPLLIASKGTIINIGSVAGTATMPWQGYYNASKAVIHLLTSQLRIELSPFGVNAICVVGGVVRTKFFDNMPTKSLPSGSLYAAGAEEISIVQSGAVAGQDGWDADVFAHSVVTNAMKRTPKLIHWTGDSANVMWYVGTFLWGTFWVCINTCAQFPLANSTQDLVTILPLRFKFRELTAKIHAAQKSK